jgi:hypothetical protein
MELTIVPNDLAFDARLIKDLGGTGAATGYLKVMRLWFGPQAQRLFRGRCSDPVCTRRSRMVRRT